MQVPDADLTNSRPRSNGRLGELASHDVTRKEKELREYLALLLRRKWLVLGIVALTTSVVALYSLRLPYMYEAAATLQLDSKEYVYMEDSRGTVLRAYNNYDYQNTQIQLLSNPQLVRQVVIKLDLEHNPAFAARGEDPSLLSTLKRGFRGKGTPPQVAPAPAVPPAPEDVNNLSQARITQLEPIVGRILSGLKVQPRDRTSLVMVSFTDGDPVLASQIVDTLTKIFVSNTDNYETRGAQEAAATLSLQIADLQMKIKQAEDERLDYLKRHNLPLEKGDGRDLIADRLSKLSSELLEAENETKNLSTAYASASAAAVPWTVPAIAESPQIQSMSKSLNELEQKRAGLVAIYTDTWPDL